MLLMWISWQFICTDLKLYNNKILFQMWFIHFFFYYFFFFFFIFNKVTMTSLTYRNGGFHVSIFLYMYFILKSNNFLFLTDFHFFFTRLLSSSLFFDMLIIWFVVSFNKNESPIFVLLCVLCLQRQPFRILFYAIILLKKASLALHL